MAQRDLLEAADDELWASMIVDGGDEVSRQRYQAAVRRPTAMGFSYRTAAEIAAEPIDALLKRIEAIMTPQTSPHVIAAIAGKIDKPDETISGALELYFNEIAADQLRRKAKSSASAGKTSALD